MTTHTDGRLDRFFLTCLAEVVRLRRVETKVVGMVGEAANASPRLGDGVGPVTVLGVVLYTHPRCGEQRVTDWLSPYAAADGPISSGTVPGGQPQSCHRR